MRLFANTPIGWGSVVVLLVTMLANVPGAGAETVTEAEGRELVEANCSDCHAVGRADASPHAGRSPVPHAVRQFSDGCA
jgi:mono/diheme cytochrome c family protein